jgi:hypothetical protein
LGGRLALPLATGTAIASDRIKVRTTAVQLAVVNYDDVDVADTCTIQKFSADFIKAVLNHDGCYVRVN